jgi:uncharacterized protein HemY
MRKLLSAFLFISLLTTSVMAFAGAQQDANILQKEWAVAKFQTPKNKQIKEFQDLIKQAEAIQARHPNDPSVMVWHATILSTYASIKGGMGVLKHVKKAKSLLEQAIKMNPRIENGFAHGVLGALYARVPGWPVAFGSDAKAEQNLLIALKLSPNGADSNYYYGDYLVEQGKYEKARVYLNKARNAPIRKGHEIQDRGRKGEIMQSLNKARRGR